MLCTVSPGCSVASLNSQTVAREILSPAKGGEEGFLLKVTGWESRRKLHRKEIYCSGGIKPEVGDAQ